jgi:DNA helicase II / ATP-dependent DNA helicase PcrA
MTRRMEKPDTDADRLLKACVESDPVRSFIMIAGAGSGKTTSLVKGLAHVDRLRGKRLRAAGQKIACVTYTEVAEREIREDVQNGAVFQVSTIHSFLWELIRPFQLDIRDWLLARIEEKIQERRAKLANPRTQQRTRERLGPEIADLEATKRPVAARTRFTYSAGGKLSEGILGHDDIIKMVPALLQEKALFRKLVAQRFPFIFVDESQDTTPEFVKALTAIDGDARGRFCVGFFGDPMQKIYQQGIGEIAPCPGWEVIRKEENFRSAPAVLDVVNKIRLDGDGLQQTLGKPEQWEAFRGSARVFIVPSDDRRSERIQAIRRWAARASADDLWNSDAKEADVRVLVIVHRMAARRLGFADLYAAMSDDAPASIKEGFADGTTWAVQPFLKYLLPLVEAYERGRHFEVMTLLREKCASLQGVRRGGESVQSRLRQAAVAIGRAREMLRDSQSSVGDVLLEANASGLIALDARFEAHIIPRPAGSHEGVRSLDSVSVDAELSATMKAFLGCPAKQFWGYRTYIEDESPFSTQQGIKGAEYQRVLAVLDDEESTHIQFKYNKYLGLEPLSSTDIDNRNEGKETVVDRTRRLMYVCCSRAIRELAIVHIGRDPGAAERRFRELGLVPETNIHVQSDDLEAWVNSAPTSP